MEKLVSSLSTEKPILRSYRTTKMESFLFHLMKNIHLSLSEKMIVWIYLVRFSENVILLILLRIANKIGTDCYKSFLSDMQSCIINTKKSESTSESESERRDFYGGCQ